MSGTQKFTEHMCERVLRCLDYIICMIHVRRWECCYGNSSLSWILSCQRSQFTVRQAHLWTCLLEDAKYYLYLLLQGDKIVFCPGLLRPCAPALQYSWCLCDLEAAEGRDLTEFCAGKCWDFPSAYTVSFNFHLAKKATDGWVFLHFQKSSCCFYKVLDRVINLSWLSVCRGVACSR